MRIRRVQVYQVDLPLHEGAYKWSGGKSVEVFDSTVVRIETEQGLAGYGETCPLGPAYLPAYAAGVRAGIAELAPRLIGMDPCELERINRAMDAALKGHPYTKSAIDIACWDLLGQAASMAAWLLAAGTPGKRFALPNARVMIHQPMGGAHGQASDIEIHAREILKVRERMNEILAVHTGRPIKQIAVDTERDYYMSGEEALAYGLIDKVLHDREAIAALSGAESKANGKRGPSGGKKS